jgi:hypothetical protein
MAAGSKPSLTKRGREKQGHRRAGKPDWENKNWSVEATDLVQSAATEERWARLINERGAGSRQLEGEQRHNRSAIKKLHAHVLEGQKSDPTSENAKL